jgi:hypothetical protein
LFGIAQIALTYAPNFLAIVCAYGIFGVGDGIYYGCQASIACQVSGSANLSNQAIGYYYMFIAFSLFIGILLWFFLLIKFFLSFWSFHFARPCSCWISLHYFWKLHFGVFDQCRIFLLWMHCSNALPKWGRCEKTAWVLFQGYRKKD